MSEGPAAGLALQLRDQMTLTEKGGPGAASVQVGLQDGAWAGPGYAGLAAGPFLMSLRSEPSVPDWVCRVHAGKAGP